jgi:hypothetical protein
VFFFSFLLANLHTAAAKKKKSSDKCTKFFWEKKVQKIPFFEEKTQTSSCLDNEFVTCRMSFIFLIYWFILFLEVARKEGWGGTLLLCNQSTLLADR